GEGGLVVEEAAEHRRDRAGGGDGGAHALAFDGVAQGEHLVVERGELDAARGDHRLEAAGGGEQRTVSGGQEPAGQGHVRLDVAAAAHRDEQGPHRRSFSSSHSWSRRGKRSIMKAYMSRMSSSRRRRSGSSPTAWSPCSASARKPSNSAILARKARAKTSSASR